MTELKNIALIWGGIYVTNGAAPPVHLDEVRLSEVWWLTTAKSAALGQESWDDEDLWKTVDFTEAPYWAYSDDGKKYAPIWSADDIKELLADEQGLE